MKKLSLILVVLIAVFTAVITSNGHRVSPPDNRTVVRRAINERGWKIPGLKESNITDARRMLQKRYGTASVPIHITVLKPQADFHATIPIYRLSDGETLIVAERKVLVQSIIKCDINNRIFVYILNCVIILDEPSGRSGYSGMFGVHYSDRDGDGTFESFEEGAPFVTPDIQIPDWVVNNP